MLRFFDLEFEMMKSLSLSPSQPHHTMYCKQIKLNEILRMRLKMMISWVMLMWRGKWTRVITMIVLIRKSKMNSNYSIGFHGHGLWKVRMLRLTYQISDKTCKMEVPEVKADNEDEKENGDNDGMPQTRDASTGSQDKGQGESGDDQHSDTEELYVEHV
eukprot:942107_1